MLKGVIERDNETIESSTTMAPIVNSSNGINGALFYYIAPDKCTECVGFHEEPSCALVCPVDACVPDPEHVESNEQLRTKKQWLHQEQHT